MRTYLLVLCVALLISVRGAPDAAEKNTQVALLKINRQYESRTVIKKSTIPGAGNGLFAVVKIKKGEVIGELGGRLLPADQYPKGNHYIASVPECVREKLAPYRFIDAKDYGAHVSRINFAPRKINSRETHFQNAAIEQICEPPYFIFVALQDIEPGTEIWSSLRPLHEDSGSS